MVADAELFAVLLGNHGYCAVCLFCRSKEEVAADDILLLASQRESHLGILACHECDIAFVITALVTENFCILDGTAQGAEGNLYLIVLENNLLLLSLTL